jgi:hypothetical protein
MTTKTKTQPKAADKPKAPKYEVTQLVITSANLKVFSTGKRGFFGKALDPATGKRFQIIGAVELG